MTFYVAYCSIVFNQKHFDWIVMQMCIFHIFLYSLSFVHSLCSVIVFKSNKTVNVHFQEVQLHI